MTKIMDISNSPSSMIDNEYLALWRAQLRVVMVIDPTSMEPELIRGKGIQ
jgi:hypothetical protein